MWNTPITYFESLGNFFASLTITLIASSMVSHQALYLLCKKKFVKWTLFCAAHFAVLPILVILLTSK